MKKIKYTPDAADKLRNIKKEKNFFCATTDISAHLLIPKVIIGTSGSVRLLSENHQLLVEE